MTATLTFSGLHWLWPTAAFAAVSLLILAWSYRALAGYPLRGTCLALKAAGMIALALCLLEPRWLGERPRPGANLFAVVADNSQGLQLRDAGEALSRGEQLRALLGPTTSAWQAALAQTFEVRRYGFDARLRAVEDFKELTFEGRMSAMGAALRTLEERFRGRPLAGVLLFTDGNATDLPGGTLPDLAGLPPVYPVAIGRDGDTRDVALQQVHATQSAFEDAPVTVQAEVKAAGFHGEAIVARLIDRAGNTVQEQTATPRDETPLAFRFQLKPEQAGLSFYRVEAAPGASAPAPASAAEVEATRANNTRVVAVDRGRGPFRVLYVAGRPNWEFKFLNRAVAEDAQVQLVALIRVAKREPKFDFRGRAGETSNPLYRGFGDQAPEDVQRYDQPVLVRLNTRDELELRAGFPRTAAELYGYHAVILDDVEAEFFAPDQAQLLQRFVSERGGGVLMLGGMESFQEGAYARTPIGDMLPVYLDREPEQSEAPGALQLQLAREGWLQAWARLRDNETDERARLEAMPAFGVINRVRGLKPGASAIATVRDERGGEAPALAVHRFGRGRTAALMLGDVWRWGMRDPASRADMDKAWRQLVRWLVADVPARVQMNAEPAIGDANAAMRLHVRVRDETFQPMDDATVSIEVEPVVFAGDAAPAGRAVTLQGEPSLKEPGLYEATYLPRATGGYKAVAKVRNNAGAEIGQAEAGWSTDLAAEEFRSLAPNTAVLEEIARRTGGRVVAADELEDFAQRLPETRAPVMATQSFAAWHTPAVFGFALACLLGEWGLRRWKGMP